MKSTRVLGLRFRVPGKFSQSLIWFGKYKQNIYNLKLKYLSIESWNTTNTSLHSIFFWSEIKIIIHKFEIPILMFQFSKKEVSFTFLQHHSLCTLPSHFTVDNFTLYGSFGAVVSHFKLLRAFLCISRKCVIL